MMPLARGAARMRRRSILLAVAVLALAAAAAQAATGLGRATVYHARFSTAHAGAATGLHLLTRGRPPAAGTTEAAAVSQTVVLPAGTRLDLAALPQCQATDAMLAAQGAEGACPASSRVGTGGADGVLDGHATHFDVGVYAVRGRLVFAAERGGAPLKQYFNGVASGRRLRLVVPTLGGRIAPTEFDATIPARPGGRAWLRTPARCPRTGHWTSRAVFQGLTAATGGRPVGPSQTLVDHEPCRD